MGTVFFSIATMKLLLCFLALTSAESTLKWFMDNWWEEAKVIFNFAHGNFDKFKSTVDAIPDDVWDPLWNFCNKNGDSVITGDELSSCFESSANWLEVPEEYKDFMFNFGAKYFSTVDLDGSGDLSYDEFKYTMAGIAAADARVAFRAFDADNNGKLAGDELTAYQKWGEEAMKEWGYPELSPARAAAMESAWIESQNDGNANDCSVLELALFTIKTYNIWLE